MHVQKPLTRSMREGRMLFCLGTARIGSESMRPRTSDAAELICGALVARSVFWINCGGDHG